MSFLSSRTLEILSLISFSPDMTSRLNSIKGLLLLIIFACTPSVFCSSLLNFSAPLPFSVTINISLSLVLIVFLTTTPMLSGLMVSLTILAISAYEVLFVVANFIISFFFPFSFFSKFIFLALLGEINRVTSTPVI
uniref:Uncharacterized protein n=1 Tax=Cacopsylla melanoneura TaxID=428564 RepID=A0A8D9B0K2_9HEMI